MKCSTRRRRQITYVWNIHSYQVPCHDKSGFLRQGWAMKGTYTTKTKLYFIEYKGICAIIGKATNLVWCRGFDPYQRRPRGVAVDLRVQNGLVGVYISWITPVFRMPDTVHETKLSTDLYHILTFYLLTCI